MKKLIISGIVALSFVGGVASAQAYSSCVSISTTLSAGSRGSQVLALQQFLVSQNYPGSGTWMETGYYGQATVAAVRDFQQSRGLPQSGSVDSMTLSALQSCGGVSNNYSGTTYSYSGYPGYTTSPYGTNYPYNTTNPYNYVTTYPYNNPYPYNYNYPYGSSAPTITSLSQNTGTPGQNVTIFGQGFQQTNTVYFNGIALSGISSSGTSLTFTIPYTSGYANNETVNLYVTNSAGTSNTLSFTLNPSTCGSYGCSTCNNVYPYNYSYGNCGCGNAYAYTSNCSTCGSVYTAYPYTNNCQGNTNSPTITYLSPQSGGAGTVVTIYGNGFTTSNNTIHFGNGVLTGYGSPDGQSLSFTIPSQLTGYGSQPLVLGSYNISVTNSNNVTSNTAAFTVTSTNGSGSGTPSISSIAPSSAHLGSQVTIYGSNFSTNSMNTISFGSGAIQDVYSNGNILTFTVPSYVTPYCAPGNACPQYAQQITPGTYNVSVMDQYGTSTPVSFTVL